jgi:P27 family predicted phage terminase small subunit
VRADRLPEVVRTSGRVVEGKEPPAPIKLSKAARPWYDDIVATLAEAGVIEECDKYVISLAAVAWGEIVMLSRVIAEEGMFAHGSTGQLKEHPAVRMRRDATSTFEKLIQNIALSPVARARLGLAALGVGIMSKELDAMLNGDATSEAEDLDAVVVALPGT